jgi:hypothetical protein
VVYYKDGIRWRRRCDYENRNWTLTQAARFQLGIAVRQSLRIRFACDSPDDIQTIAAIVAAEFPTLRREDPWLR